MNNTMIMLLGWLFNVLRPAQEFFTYMETSPLPLNTGTYIAWWPYTIYNRKVENSFYTVLLFTE
jgi:hypothetical protein